MSKSIVLLSDDGEMYCRHVEDADEMVPACSIPVCECEGIVIEEDDDGDINVGLVDAAHEGQLAFWLHNLEGRGAPYGLYVSEDKFGDSQAFVLLFEGDPLIPKIEDAWAERDADEAALTAMLLSRIAE